MQRIEDQVYDMRRHLEERAEEWSKKSYGILERMSKLLYSDLALIHKLAAQLPEIDEPEEGSDREDLEIAKLQSEIDGHRHLVVTAIVAIQAQLNEICYECELELPPKATKKSKDKGAKGKRKH